MNLVIVESPTKAKTLRKFLGNDFVIEASMGHIRDLPKSSLGVDVDKNFEPIYEVSQGKNKTIAALKKLAANADTIYLATDPDREGEAISWHLVSLLEGKSKRSSTRLTTSDSKKMKTSIKSQNSSRFVRVTFHEITKSAIMEALKNPGELNMALVDAQQARRVVDRLVGYTISPVLWRKVRRGLSAGRVQSVAVRLIVEREREIKAFKPIEYWQINVKLQIPNSKSNEFIAELVEVEGKKVVIKDDETTRRRDDESKSDKKIIFLDSKDVVEPILTDLKVAQYTVDKVEKKEQIKRPNPPFTTSTLQQAAANVLGWSGKQTMAVAQQLYEAGLITYHRTDSFNLAAEAVTAARGEITTKYGPDYLPEKPNFYQTKSKNAQEAHEAIRPTNINFQVSSNNFQDLEEKQRKLYMLIWRRFMACQMKPAVFDQTTITVDAKCVMRNAKNANYESRITNYGLRASGSVVKFMGWKKAYEENDKLQITNNKSNSNIKYPILNNKAGEIVILPSMTENQQLDLKEVVSEQKFTQPPPRYNDASLIKELEKRGIGRPSTYASILSTIVDRGYTERIDKKYQPTSVGEAVNDFLVSAFPSVMEYQFTAEMEEDLDRIARDEKEWRQVMKSFWGPFEKLVKSAEKDSPRVEIPVEKTGELCPKCKEGELVIRSGRFGKFMSCNRFPECDYKASLKQTVEGVVCPNCQSEIVVKRTKTGRTFWGCSSYPKCTWASWNDPTKQNDKTQITNNNSNSNIK